MSNNGLMMLILNNGKRPTMTSGLMTAELLHRFKDFACGYLLSKDNLESNDYIAHIAYALRILFSVTGSRLSKPFIQAFLLLSSWSRSVPTGLPLVGKRIWPIRSITSNRDLHISMIFPLLFAVITCYWKTWDTISPHYNFAPKLRPTSLMICSLPMITTKRNMAMTPILKKKMRLPTMVTLQQLQKWLHGVLNHASRALSRSS